MMHHHDLLIIESDEHTSFGEAMIDLRYMA